MWHREVSFLCQDFSHTNVNSESAILEAYATSKLWLCSWEKVLTQSPIWPAKKKFVFISVLCHKLSVAFKEFDRLLSILLNNWNISCKKPHLSSWICLCCGPWFPLESGCNSPYSSLSWCWSCSSSGRWSARPPAEGTAGIGSLSSGSHAGPAPKQHRISAYRTC